MTTPSSSTTRIKAGELAVRTDQLLGVEQVLVRSSERRPHLPQTVDSQDRPGAGAVAEQDPRPLIAAPPIVVSPDGSAAERLADLQSIHAAQCPQCTHSDAHQNLVFGEGNPEARLMFVGEAPGVEEDRTGRPFVGRAGHKLDEMIKAMGFTREEVYIANVLKSRPPDNRTPLQHEVEACGPYLAAQTRIISPEVIVALGGPAAKLLLKTETGITRLRGVWGVYDDGEGQWPVMPTFHPAYLLRNPTLEVRGQVWDDLKAVLERLGRPVPGH